MQNIRTIRSCKKCGKPLHEKDLTNNSWVCDACDKKQLTERGLMAVEEEKEQKDQLKREHLQQLRTNGYFDIGETARNNSVSRRTIWNRLKQSDRVRTVKYSHRKLVKNRDMEKLIKMAKFRGLRLYFNDPLVRKGLHAFAEIHGITHSRLVSLEEAVEVTGLSRRYF